jgi:TolB-like protein
MRSLEVIKNVFNIDAGRCKKEFLSQRIEYFMIPAIFSAMKNHEPKIKIQRMALATIRKICQGNSWLLATNGVVGQMMTALQKHKKCKIVKSHVTFLLKMCVFEGYMNKDDMRKLIENKLD